MESSSKHRLTLAALIAATGLVLSSAGLSMAETTPASARTPSKSTKAAAQPVLPIEQQLKQDLEGRIGSKIDSITPMPMAQLYEIRIGDDIFYTDPTGNYLIIGSIVDSRTRENLTRARIDAIKEASLPQWKFAELPLDSAVKVVRGTGKKSVAIFEDPNCGYCKKLEKSILDIGDVTIYVFLYPVLGPDSLTKSKQIWCAPDRSKAWVDWMQNATALAGEATCSTPVDKTLALGKKLKVDGTPTLFFSNNKRVEGAISAAELQKLLLAS
jgi:thiol:disulfide interchange protein DsbC